MEPSESTLSRTEFDDALVFHLLRGVDEVRSSVGLSEEQFRLMSRAHNSRGRRHYVYQALNEIEEVGLYLHSTKGDLEKELPTQPKDDTESHLVRNTLSLVSSQQARTLRLLIELLVELINFSHINRDEIFDHFLLYKELSQLKKVVADARRYFGCSTGNHIDYETLLRGSITNAETGKLSWRQPVKLQDCWYLANEKLTGKPKPGGHGKLANFSQLFDRALPRASKNERLALGFSYGRSYGATSREIHLGTAGVMDPPRQELLQTNRVRIYILGVASLLRLPVNYGNPVAKRNVSGLEETGFLGCLRYPSEAIHKKGGLRHVSQVGVVV
jgi:hypothetical protein